jgi:tryptophanyl-tRNA synthetase
MNEKQHPDLNEILERNNHIKDPISKTKTASMELNTNRYKISVEQLSEGGPGGYESTYLTSEGQPASDRLYAILDSFDGKLLPATNKVIRQRNGIALLTALEKGENIGIASGFKPSGAYHFGHKLASSAVSFFQKNGAQIFIPVADIECEMDTKISTEQYKYWAADNLLDWGANGVNLDAAHVYLQSEEHRVNKLAYFVARSLKFDFAADIYGMDKMVSDFPFLFAGITQVGDILLPQYNDFGNCHSFMVSGQDQDGHMKMTVTLVEESLKNNINLPGVKTVPSGFYIPHIRGISGNKASSSKAQGTLYLGSGPNHEDLGQRINSTLNKYDHADGEHLERCALDMIRYIDVFNQASKVDFSEISRDKKYLDLINSSECQGTRDEQKKSQSEIDKYLISICKNEGQDNISLVRELLPVALHEHQKKRREVLDYAIARAEAKKDRAWSLDGYTQNMPKFWNVPEKAIVDPNKRNPTEWYNLVANVADKLLP